ncbi:MAG: helix-turn-helix domain-containing protein [Candidatus Competibacteraceae bacterium]|nr:helix-turn-helix domain-containing protein [Candidatus Competibacteraceae bacterium]
MKRIERTGIYPSSEIAELFGLAERHLWPHLNSGVLPGRKVGRHWYCTGQDILDFVSSGNQAGITHTGSAEQPTVNAQLSDSHPRHSEQTPGALPTVIPTAPAEVTAHTSDKTVQTIVADKAQLSDSQLTPRQQRRKAVMDAFVEAGNDKHVAAELLNQRIAEGGPKPERGEEWTADRVRQTISRLQRYA